MASNKLAERLARRQPITIEQEVTSEGPTAASQQKQQSPETHREKLALGWKRVATVLPPEEHQAFKIAAVKQNAEMSDIIRELIAEWLKVQK